MKKVFLILIFAISSNCFAQWTLMSNSGTITALKCVYFATPDTGYICGGDYYMSQPGVFLRTVNGGASWQSMSYGSSSHLYNLQFFNSRTGYICGGNSLVMKTTNAGLNWVSINSGIQALPVGAVYFQNELTGFAQGSEGKSYYIYKTTNGGQNWILKVFSAPSEFRYYNFNFVNQNTGFALRTGSIYKTTNQGENWTNFGYSGTAMHFFDNQNALMVGGATSKAFGWIYKTTNQGVNFTVTDYQNPGARNYGIRFINSNTGYVISDSGKIRYTSNGGTNWIRQATPTYGRDVARLFGIDFINQNTGFAVGDSGVILKTTNGGLTYVNGNGRVISDFSLSQNYPNPFNPSTIINYQLTINSFVILNVYDVNGRLLKELVNEKQSAGNYSIDFDGSGLPSGTYVYRLQAGEFSETKKMVLLK